MLLNINTTVTLILDFVDSNGPINFGSEARAGNENTPSGFSRIVNTGSTGTELLIKVCMCVCVCVCVCVSLCHSFYDLSGLHELGKQY